MKQSRKILLATVVASIFLVVLLIATVATAQPDWSKLTVLRDIEYVPGGPTRSPT